MSAATAGSRKRKRDADEARRSAADHNRGDDAASLSDDDKDDADGDRSEDRTGDEASDGDCDRSASRTEDEGKEDEDGDDSEGDGDSAEDDDYVGPRPLLTAERTRPAWRINAELQELLPRLPKELVRMVRDFFGTPVCGLSFLKRWRGAAALFARTAIHCLRDELFQINARGCIRVLDMSGRMTDKWKLNDHRLTPTNDFPVSLALDSDNQALYVTTCSVFNRISLSDPTSSSSKAEEECGPRPELMREPARVPVWRRGRSLPVHIEPPRSNLYPMTLMTVSGGNLFASETCRPGASRGILLRSCSEPSIFDHRMQVSRKFQHLPPISGMVVAPRRNHVYICGCATTFDIEVYSLADGGWIGSLPAPHPTIAGSPERRPQWRPQHMALSPDQDYLIVNNASRPGDIGVFDLEALRWTRPFLSPHRDSIEWLNFVDGHLWVGHKELVGVDILACDPF